ncbi:LysR family transcriptional regulator [Bosea sp. R86505]|uniref:LysR family transcriptional regulator n=1 Tax=Bosea sp. R86505 TaxID=3101710 RepID=UPI00366F7CC4
MDRFATLSAFVKVAELHGFAPAARRLGLSPSAVTQLVAALEAHLDVRLMQRTTRSVTLTDEGERYLLQARRILTELEEADASMQAARTAPSGRLVVSAPLAFGRFHVGPLFSAYLSRFPAVQGELLLGDRLVNLVDEGVDVAVRIGHLGDSSLKSRRVGETRRVLVASPDYLARNGEPVTPADIARHRCIHFAGFNSALEWVFEKEGSRLRVGIVPSFVTNGAESAVQHAIDGGGLTLVLAYQAAAAIRAGALRILLPKFEREPSPIQLVYPNARLLSAKVRAFIDMAASETNWSFVAIA